MHIAGMVQDSIVDGPGLRFTLFVQGCSHNCAGCHNPNTHDPKQGMEMAADEVIQQLLRNPLTDGLTLSGGEPFEQPEDCVLVARAARAAGLNVWTYSGYTYETLRKKAEQDTAVRELLLETNVLVDGPFVLSQRSMSLKWRGSKNQRLIDVKASLASGSAVMIE